MKRVFQVQRQPGAQAALPGHGPSGLRAQSEEE